MVPPPFQTTGRSRQRRPTASPAVTGERSGRPRETQRNASIRSRSRLTNTGDRRKAGQTFHCAKGTPREQCRRRPQGHNGCEEDDRLPIPRFRSAPMERQASVGCEIFLTHRCPLVPPARPPCRARSCPPRARSPPPTPPPPLGRLLETAASRSDPDRIRRRTRPRVLSFRKTRARYQVSNEAALATATARRIARQGHQVASSSAVLPDDAQPLDDSLRPVRGVLAALPSAAGARDGRKPLPAIVNLSVADGTVSPVSAACRSLSDDVTDSQRVSSSRFVGQAPRLGSVPGRP